MNLMGRRQIIPYTSTMEAQNYMPYFSRWFFHRLANSATMAITFPGRALQQSSLWRCIRHNFTVRHSPQSAVFHP